MKVSIIIPTHNYGAFLADCLDSVLNQTYPDWEAWIIDDGSTDSTYDLVRKYKSLDERINYHFQLNQGLSNARNKGLELIGGDFIQFLDADDKLSNEKLTLQIRHFQENPKVDISYCRTYFFEHENPNKKFKDFRLQNKDIFPVMEGQGFEVLSVLTNANFNVVSSPLIRKSNKTESIRFKETVKNSEDWYYWLECAFKGCNFSYLTKPEAHTQIRIHTESMSQQTFNMYYGELQLRDWLFNQLNLSGLDPKEKELLVLKNQYLKEKLVKHSILTGPLWSFSHLKEIYPHLGLTKLLQYHKQGRKHQKKALKN